jgi:hypothetical protein
VRLLPSASDPVVGDVVRRVQRKRLDFLAEVFRDAGFPPAESRLRARLAYSLYLGGSCSAWSRARSAQRRGNARRTSGEPSRSSRPGADPLSIRRSS